MEIFTIWLVAAIAAQILAVILAHKKNRNAFHWGIACLFLPPLVLLLAFLPRCTGPDCPDLADFDEKHDGLEDRMFPD